MHIKDQFLPCSSLIACYFCIKTYFNQIRNEIEVLVSTIVSIMIWPASIMAQSELIPMIEIPAGNFYMGTLGGDENYDEAPMHKVHISKPFKMGLTESD